MAGVSEDMGGDAVDLFQLYLISDMHVPRATLKDALARLGRDEADIDPGKSAMLRQGFEAPGERADLYIKILGPPIAEMPLNKTGTYHGSRELRFRLPLWPDLDFVVNESRDGFAWGVCFQRPQGYKPPLPNSLADLVAWKFLKDEISERFGQPEFFDGWSASEELYYAIPETPGAVPQRRILVFDYKLFQYCQTP
ncbi:MAG TPA: hypothetical protein VI756_31965 [Blastocatellia bacterium]